MCPKVVDLRFLANLTDNGISNLRIDMVPEKIRWISFSHFESDECGALNQWLEAGQKRFSLCRTPHLPHGWDASVLFEETSKTMLCSDLFHQVGDVEPLTRSDVVGRSREAMKEYQAGILADYAPYTHYAGRLFEKLAAREP